MKKYLAVALLIAAATPASAALKVLACEPEWGALVQELGGDKVDVTLATTALQDPHHVQAKPSLIARARNAELLACTGAGLEIGWLPVLIQQSGNAAIQPGKPGNFAASDFVQKLDVPTRVDRADGDVHPEGNPHIQTDPRNIAKVAVALAQRLEQIDPANRATLPAAGARLRQTLGRGARALVGAGRTAAWHADPRATQGLDLHGELAGPAVP